MTALSYPMVEPFRFLTRKSGESDAAVMIQDLENAAMKYLVSRPSIQLLMSEIIEARLERQDLVAGPEVDSDANLGEAIRFAQLLPRSLPIPEVTIDPDGEISFDWFGQGDEMFSVSVRGDGRLAYAGRFREGRKIRGIEWLSESIPEEIIRAISRAVR